MITYKFRMYPNKEVREKLDLSLDICRQTYNNLLEELNNQAKIDRGKIQHKIVEMKEEHPEIAQVYSKTLQYECYRLFSNLSALRELKKRGHKVGRLRFKGRQWFKTMNYNQSGFTFEQNSKKGLLHLSKIGNIKVKAHRQVEGNIKQVTLKKSLGKWYCMLVSDSKNKMKCGKGIVGIDLGINNYVYDSNGNSVAHPMTIQKYSDELKVAQQNLSRKKKGSNNRYKAKFAVAKLHERIENTRNDFLHKLSHRYIAKYKTIVVEDLNIKSMMQSSYNARNMADASWGKFVQFLCYKAESAGGKVEKINPKNTTKQCSNCGNIQHMPLWIRTYDCKNCGMSIDRDYNSAKGILRKFLGKGLTYVENNPSAQETEQGLSMKQEAITSAGAKL